MGRENSDSRDRGNGRGDVKYEEMRWRERRSRG